MGYLLLAIACSASIALLFKVSETRRMNRHALTAANYAVASAASLAVVVQRTVADPGWMVLREVVWAIAIGVASGFLLCWSFLIYQECVKRHGAGLAGSFIKLGMFLPVGLAVVAWGEESRWTDYAGIGLALAAMAAANAPTGRDWRRGLRLMLLALFVVGGLAEFTSGVFERYGRADHMWVFLFTAFGTALVVATHRAKRVGKPAGLRDLAFGGLLGVPNLGSLAFLILALSVLPSGLAYAVFGAGTILAIGLAAWLLFGETPDLRGRVAMGLAALAVVAGSL